MREIRRILPNEHVVYLGDTARLPYGNKSREAIRRFSLENALFLSRQNIKILVAACNTASAYALDLLQQECNLPVIGVIESGVEKAAQMTTKGPIVVLGTKATIESGSYQEKLASRLPGVEIIGIPCPLFVPLIEEGFVEHPATLLIVKEYFKNILDRKPETILLGCTHYPLLKPVIRKIVGPSVHLIDSANTCAETILKQLTESDLLEESKQEPSCQYFVTDDPGKFQSFGQVFLGSRIEKVDLASFELQMV